MASPHLGEGIRDKLRLWKVISVAEDVGKSGWIGSKQSVAIDKTTVGKGVAVLLCPGMNDVAVLLVVKLSQVSEKEGRRGRGWEKTERRAETGNENKEKGP